MKDEFYIDFEQLKANVQSQDPQALQQAAKVLYQFFFYIRLRQLPKQFQQITHAQLLTESQRLFACFTQLILNPHYPADSQAVYLFCSAKLGYNVTFTLSAAHQPRALHEAIEQLPISDTQKLARHVIACSDLSAIALGESAFQALLNKLPLPLQYPLMIGMLSIRGYFLPEIVGIREQLFQLKFDIRALMQAGYITHLDLMAPWMQCAYHPTAEPRLAFKRHLNKIIQASFLRARIITKAKKHETIDRPTLLIIAESFHSAGVIFRCYHHLCKHFATYFDVHLLSSERAATDPVIQRLFGQQIHVLHSDEVKQNLVAAASIEPDVIFYPSIGLSAEVVQLAECRIAPIQVAGIGHPDSTQMNTIDYVLLDRAFLPPQPTDCAPYFTEKIVAIGGDPTQTYRFIEIPHQDVPIDIRAEPDVLNVGVIGNSMKLNDLNLQWFAELSERYGDRIVLHFFPNALELEHLHSAHLINMMVPGSVVHESCRFSTYLTSVSQLDFAIGTFPFGGSNSLVDAFCVGVPVVSLLGTVPLSRTDRHIHEMIGLGDQLCCEHIDELMLLCDRLITDHAYRVEVSRYILDHKSQLFAGVDEETEETGVYAEAVHWISQQHPVLQREDTRVIEFHPAVARA